ncbi:mycothiol transferase [Streptomyces sp. P6-2-1]|uniref:mycothiol transferase n=1 Tax=unclassified Streptomyces TaxID=2593676 RepID=UPI003D35B7C4
MRGAELLSDGFGRITEEVHAAVDGLTGEQLAERLDPEANSIAWLVWHLSRVQDDHVADAAGEEQVWTGSGWAKRLGLPFPDGATGYGMSAAEVGRVRVSAPGPLLGYFDAVQERTLAYVSGLSDADFDRVVDENWSPPVTLGVRLVSVLSDCLQHAGQAAYVRGALERR